MESFPAEVVAILKSDNLQLLQGLPNLFIETIDGETLLFEAVRQNAANCVQFLLQNEQMCQKLSNAGETPLMVAVTFERFGLIPLLSYYVGMQDENGTSALMRAVQYQYCEQFQPLLQEQTLEDNDGFTALMLAAQDENIQWLQLLSKEYGMRDHDNMSALQISQMRGCQASVAFLQRVEK